MLFSFQKISATITKNMEAFMQKKKSVVKKQNISTEEKSTVQQEPAEQKKDFSKSLSFFAIFIICLGAAALYPYLMQEQKSSYAPAFDIAQIKTEEQIEEDLPDSQEEVQIKQADCSEEEQTILSQRKNLDELNQKIHQLELENLTLKEKTSSSEKSISLTVQLMNEIYAGKPFKATINALLKQDPLNSFALTVQEEMNDYADKGVATTAQLKELFYSGMKMAQNSLYVSQPDASWNEKWLNFFKSLVQVYPEEIKEDETDAKNLLFLARKQIQAEQFEQAVNTIAKLPAEVKEPLNGFIQRAVIHIEAEKIIKNYLNEMKGN